LRERVRISRDASGISWERSGLCGNDTGFCGSVMAQTICQAACWRGCAHLVFCHARCRIKS
jgi:hypothetical protein